MSNSTAKVQIFCGLLVTYFIAVGNCSPTVAVKTYGQSTSKFPEERDRTQSKLHGVPKTSTSSNVDINTDILLRNVSDKFLSVTIPVFMIRSHWKNLNLSLPRIVTLAKALTPGYLRVGGTGADFLIFNESMTSPPVVDSHNIDSNFTMTVQDWDIINDFAVNVGWQLIFGLNVLLRGSDGKWDPNNALKLLKYTIDKGYHVDWELGNEPNLFPGKTNITVSPTMLAKDFRTLRNILNSKKELRDSLLLGPDTTKPKEQEDDTALEFLEGFVSSCDVTNATTFHQYYLCSHPPTPESFYDPDNLAILPKQIQAAKDVVDRYRPGTPLWLGETGTTCSRGSSTLSKTYVAGFMYMDKLGVGASQGLDVVVRQTFIGGVQGMLDDDVTPLPDYWLAVLYKRLVGHRVLSTKVTTNIRGNFKDGDRIRAYAHCTRTVGTNYTAGSVTLYMMSLLANETTTVYLTSRLGYTSIDQYILTAHKGEGVISRRVDLNGKVLDLVDDHTLPDMNPHRIGPSQTIQLPPLSMAFFVLPDVKAMACL